MKAGSLMAKAKTFCASARALLELGDPDSAADRAFSAMLAAAREALLASGLDTGKTHRGTISLFSEHLVKYGPLSKDMSRILAQAEASRLVANYEGGSVDRRDAQEMIEQAETFIAAIQTEVIEPEQALWKARLENRPK